MLSICKRGISLCSNLQRKTITIYRVSPLGPTKLSMSIAHQNALLQTPNSTSSISVQRVTPSCSLHRSSNFRSRGKEKKTEENIEDLLHDKSLGFYAKFKVLFQQYGIVLVVVHCITAVFWFSLFYFAVSRGFDIAPYLEKYGVFNFLEKIGLPASDKLKSPGASNALAAYLLYEVAKPIRYPVTVVGTIYAVRFLRRIGRLRKPPKTEATVREMVETQGKFVHHKLKSTASKYRERYRDTRHLGRKLKTNGHRNIHRRK